MGDDRKRQQAAEHGAMLCSGYLGKVCGDELAYVAVVVDLVNPAARLVYASDLCREHLVTTLRAMADDIESGKLVDTRSGHH